ncbi:MAG: choice-of-anchor tandem repeat GloVer-containing protein [Candidatus Cybelea sp.]
MRRVGSALCIIILAGCSSAPATSSLPEASQAATGRTSSGKFQVLHAFSSSKNGKVPVGTLLADNGTLYGTTNFGGDPDKSCYPGNGCGTVFSLTGPSDEGVIYRFTGLSSGTRPYAGLIDLNGTFYGTTQTGGKKNEGGVFSLTPSGKEHLILAFGGKDGNDPRAGLTSVKDALFGTTYYGGSAGTGTVFTVSTSGTEKVLHSFQSGSGDGSLPLGSLLYYNNVLYGTTSSGGASRAGTVFEINTDGTGYSVLYNFKAGKSDGAFPFAGLTELNGTLYGTTEQGGAHNKGTVFAITTSGSESVLHSFGEGTDGAEPFAGLTVLNNTLYGTTAYGGTSGKDAGPNNKRKLNSEGTIYTITPSGSEQVLHSFTGGPGGRVPYANLTAMNGALYGVTIWGGNLKGPKGGVGTIFEYNP